MVGKNHKVIFFSVLTQINKNNFVGTEKYIIFVM